MRIASLLTLSVFVAACSDSAFAPGAIVVPPPCLLPAPLQGRFDPRAPDVIVVFEQGIESSEETPRLAERYGFSPRFVYTYALEGFSADLEPETVAGIRCEPSVKYVQYDGVVGIGTAGS